MLDVPHLRRLYDEQVRPAEGTGLAPRTVVEVDGPILRILGGHRGFVSSPADLTVTGSALAELVLRQRDVFAARSEPVEWKTWAHDPPELIHTLLAAGFVPEPVETVLVGSARAAMTAGTVPAGISVRTTDDGADMTRIADMESDVWAADWSWLATDIRARVSIGSVTVVVAEAGAGRQVVAAAWLAWKPGTDFAGLWGGSTRAQWRGRGIYRALVALRAALATRAGVRYLQVDASDDSRPILERLGFVPVTTTTPYVWTPPA